MKMHCKKKYTCGPDIPGIGTLFLSVWARDEAEATRRAELLDVDDVDFREKKSTSSANRHGEHIPVDDSWKWLMWPITKPDPVWHRGKRVRP